MKIPGITNKKILTANKIVLESLLENLKDLTKNKQIENVDFTVSHDGKELILRIKIC